MKEKIKAWFGKVIALSPELGTRTLDMLKKTAADILPCAAVLAVLYVLGTLCSALKWEEGVSMLMDLIGSIALVPVIAGMVTYLVGAKWEKRNVNWMDAVHLVRIKWKNMILTGLCAGLVGIAANWIGMMLYSLVQIVSMLLGWIPVLGSVVSGIVACILWLISLAMEFVVHAALVMGMMALTADGMNGRMQAQRVLTVLRGGWADVSAKLAAVFGAWVVVKGIYEVLYSLLPIGAPLVWCAVTALLTVGSMVAVSVIYLTRRDHMDGTSYYA